MTTTTKPKAASKSTRKAKRGADPQTANLFAERMEELRQKQRKPMSWPELAEQSGVSRTFLFEIEKGLKSPSLCICEKIATALNTTVAKMLK